MTLPNFIIFGALKGGTTSLYHYFNEHPEIYMSPLKEARYFAFDPNDPFLANKPDRLFPIKTLDEYRALFNKVSNEKAIGEASPGYLESPIAAARIKEHIPDVKLIASLRNPVDRAYSLYLMAVRSGRETRPVEEAFREKDDTARWAMYHANLQRYFDRFDRECIKIILLEDLIKDPLIVIQDLFHFLEVDDGFVPDLTTRHNLGGVPKSPVLNRFLKFNNKRLRLILTPFIPGKLRNLRKNIQRQNLAKPPPLPGEIRQQLAKYFHDDILRLQDSLQRDLSLWLHH